MSQRTLLIGARYRVVRALGQGSQGLVYEVEDSVREGEHLALKWIPLADRQEQDVELLKREFKALATLDHPHIVTVRDFGLTVDHPAAPAHPAIPAHAAAPDPTTQRGWYYTAELVDGVDLSTACHGAPHDRIITLAAQVADALSYLHARGIVHRDLKPSNILVDRCRIARVMDFGLAAAIGGEDATAAGTPDYLPPEVIAGHDPEARSDLYSFGAVLYHLVAGRPPYVGESPAEVISQHRDAQPVIPSSVRDDLPDELCTLILGLLAKDPDDRPESAAAVASTLAQLAQAQPAAMGGRLTAIDAEQRLQTSVFYGRERELEQLRAALSVAHGSAPGAEPARRSQVAIITGEAGVGKSTLIRRFLRDAALDEVCVIESHCHGSGSPPLHAVSHLVSQIGHYGTPDEQDRAAEIIESLSRRAAAGAEAPGTSPQTERLRLAHRVLELIGSVSCRRALIVSMEGLTEADDATLEVLAYLLRNPVSGRLLWVLEQQSAIDRQELDELALAASSVDTDHSIDLQPFSDQECRGFLESLLPEGPAPEELETWIAGQTGNPFLIIELIRSVLRRDELVVSAEGYACPRGLPETSFSDRVQELVFDKYARLDGAERIALAVLAAANEPLPVERISRSVELVEGERNGSGTGAVAANIATAIEALLQRQLLRTAREPRVDSETDAPGAGVEFPSSLERRVFYESLHEQDRVEVHLALATELRQRHQAEGTAEDCERLAHHFVRARVPEPAYAYAVEAGCHAGRLFCDDAARHWYEAALDFASDTQQRLAVLEPLAKVCRRAGEPEPARRYLEQALESLGPDRRRHRGHLLDEIGLVWRDTGDLGKAQESHRQAHDELVADDDARAHDLATVLAHLAWIHVYRGERGAARELCAQALAQIDSDRGTDRDESEMLTAHRAVVMCRAAIDLAESRFSDAAQSYRTALELAQKLGDPHAEATALSNLGVAASLGGDLTQAVEAWEASLARRRELLHLKGIAECQNNLGLAQYEVGQPTSALRFYEESLDIQRQIGNRLGVAMASLNMGEACLDLHYLQSALAATTEALNVFLDAGEDDGTVRSFAQMGKVLEELGATRQLDQLLTTFERRYSQMLGESLADDGSEDPQGGDDAAPLLRATHQRLLAFRHRLHGELDEAVHRFEDAHLHLQANGESRLIADNLLDLSNLHIERCQYDEARAALARARAEGSMRRSGLLESRARLHMIAVHGAQADRSHGQLDSPLRELDGIITVAHQAACPDLEARALRAQAKLIGANEPAQATSRLRRAVRAYETVLGDDGACERSIARRFTGADTPDSLGAWRPRIRLVEDRLGLSAARHELAEARQDLAQARADRPGASETSSEGHAVETRALLEPVLGFTSCQDLNALGQGLLEVVADFTGARRVLLVLGKRLDQPVTTLARPTLQLFSQQELRAIRRTATAQLRNRDSLVHVVDGEANTDPDLDALFNESVRSLVMVPFTARADRELHGVIYADTDDFEILPRASDERLLELVALAAGHAVGELLTREHVTAQLDQVTRLYHLSSAPARTLDPERVLEESLSAMIELTGAERGFIFLAEGDDIVCRLARDSSGQHVVNPRAEVSWSILRRTFASGQAMRLDDALSDSQLSSRDSISLLQLRSVMCVPIRSEEKTLGLAYVDNRSHTSTFDEDHLRLFGMFGSQIATALEKARHYARLEQSDRAKSEFLNNVSHELRTPLTIILGFSALLRNEELPRDSHVEGLNAIESSATELHATVERLLTLSSIDAGRLVPREAPFTVKELVDELRTEWAPRAAAKNLDLQCAIAGDVPEELVGDASLLCMVVGHLLDNAIKFTESGNIKLAVDLCGDPRALQAIRGVAMRFAVEDTGAGIDQARREQLLEPFTQADGSMTRRYGGIGLGLSICNRIVGMLGGELGFDSQPGEGSTFWFTVRLADHHAQ